MWVRIFILSFLVVLIAVESSASTEIEQNETLRECKCANFNCGCCNHIEVDFVKINGTLCSDFSYLPNDIGISLTITFNKRSIYNETLSLRNPPPICPILVKELHIEACVRFYDMDFDKHHFSGCVQIEVAAFKKIPLIKKELGCFYINHKNSSINFAHPSVILLEYHK